eukprot:3819242-Prymnesium_polylepis.1
MQAILDVVTGSDGKFFERSSLHAWFVMQEAAGVPTSSPITKEPMDKDITEVPKTKAVLAMLLDEDPDAKAKIEELLAAPEIAETMAALEELHANKD